MSHYFDTKPQVSSQPHSITLTFKGESMRVLTDRGTFSCQGLDIGTETLLEAVYAMAEGRLVHAVISPNAPASILDLGCGYGAIGLWTARCFPKADWTAVDCNLRAVELARQNFKSHGVRAQVYCSDGLASVPAKAYDWVLTNPPIRVGKQKLRALLDEAYHQLSPSGQLWLVIGKKQGAASMVRYLTETYGHCTTVHHAHGFVVLAVPASPH